MGIRLFGGRDHDVLELAIRRRIQLTFAQVDIETFESITCTGVNSLGLEIFCLLLELFALVTVLGELR